MEITDCFFNDLKVLMNIHNVKNLSVVANIADDNKLVFGDDIIINYFPDAEKEVNVFTLHKPAPDEYEYFFRDECR
jgi:hypothetical protein